MGVGAFGRPCLSAPGRDGLCGHLGEGWRSGPRCPGRPDTRGLSLLRISAPGAIVSIYICLWSEVVRDQGYGDLDFSLTLTITAAPGTHFLCGHLLTRPNAVCPVACKPCSVFSPSGWGLAP